MALFDDASLVVTPNGYKAGTLYSIKPTSGAGDMTVVRATTATRVNSAGLIESVANNVPRLDYSNGTCPSLFVEPQRTNVLTQSEGVLSTYGLFDNVTNASSSFNSFLNAIQIPISGLSYSYKGATLTLSQIYTLSFFVKMDDNSAPVLTASSSTGNFNLVGENNGIVTDNLQVISIGNNVYRVSGTLTGTGNSNNFGMVRFTTQVLKTFKMSAIQLELGSYPTSYIPTTSAAVTRNADVLTRAGFGNASTSGTLFFDLYAEKIESPNGQYILQLFAGSSIGGASFSDANGLSIIGNGTAIQIFNNAYTQQVQTLTPTAGQRVKLAIRYNGTNVSSAINGTLSNVFADTAVGVKNALRINNGENGTQAFNVVCFFPSYLTDAELISLTT